MLQEKVDRHIIAAIIAPLIVLWICFAVLACMGCRTAARIARHEGERQFGKEFDENMSEKFLTVLDDALQTDKGKRILSDANDKYVEETAKTLKGWFVGGGVATVASAFGLYNFARKQGLKKELVKANGKPKQGGSDAAG